MVWYQLSGVLFAYHFERNIGFSRQLSLILAGVLSVQYFLVSWL